MFKFFETRIEKQNLTIIEIYLKNMLFCVCYYCIWTDMLIRCVSKTKLVNFVELWFFKIIQMKCVLLLIE